MWKGQDEKGKDSLRERERERERESVPGLGHGLCTASGKLNN